MEGQMNLFPEEQNPPVRKEKGTKDPDPSQTYDERRKRFLHYMEIKGMDERWIEMAEGEIRIVIEALADYYDIMKEHIESMEIGYPKAVWEDRIKRIKKIQEKLEESLGYNRDRQLEICKERRSSRNDDIGEDALVLAAREKRTGDKRTSGNSTGQNGDEAE